MTYSQFQTEIITTYNVRPNTPPPQKRKIQYEYSPNMINHLSIIHRYTPSSAFFQIIQNSQSINKFRGLS